MIVEPGEREVRLVDESVVVPLQDIAVRIDLDEIVEDDIGRAFAGESVEEAEIAFERGRVERVVRVENLDVKPLRFEQSRVDARAVVAVPLVDDADGSRMRRLDLVGNRGCSGLASVVHHDHVEPIRHCISAQDRIQARMEIFLHVVGRNDDGQERGGHRAIPLQDVLTISGCEGLYFQDDSPRTGQVVCNNSFSQCALSMCARGIGWIQQAFLPLG